MRLIKEKKKKNSDIESEYPESVENVFASRRHLRSIKSFEKSKSSIMHYAMFFATIAIITLYFWMPESKVKSIHIEGNYYLPEDYIQTVSGVDTKDIYYLTFPLLLEKKLQNDPMIEDAEVSYVKNNVIHIQIKEKRPVGYRYDENPIVLLSDNTQAQLKPEYLDLIADVPLIKGFTDADQTRLLSKALASVESSAIANISEISQYALPYDDQALKVLMRNGGYYLGSYHNLDKLDFYDLIYKAVSDKSKCISASDSLNVAYTMTCPWNEEKDTKEFWTDEAGAVRTNSYGDQIEKHYYVDETGNDALDENGNRIAIPIDDSGNEVPDEEFIGHYNAGYYATGQLVIP